MNKDDPVREALADEWDRYIQPAPGKRDYITPDLIERTIAALRTPAPLHSGEPVAEGRCDVTLTERFTNPNCKCKTYAGNKGPCKTFEKGQSGSCVYCDHEQACHTSPPAIELDGGVREAIAEPSVLNALADEVEQSDGLSFLLTGCTRQLGIRRSALVVAALRQCALAVPKPERAAANEDVDADALWALASALHSNVPEDKRPMSWSDFSPEQIERLQKAANAFLAALSPVALHDGEIKNDK